MWNRLRYTVWAPAYDAIARAAGFDTARRLSIDRLRIASGARVLIVGAGTGLDLDFLPSNVHVTAIDVTPAMLKHLERRAAGMGRSVTARIMDARHLAFPDSSFDAVVMHLILAVMPEPARGLREAVRVLKPGGRIAVFDKFLKRPGTTLAEASIAQRVCEAAVFRPESATRTVDCGDTARHRT